MLRITVPKREFYDERNGIFISPEDCELNLEHSLVSLSKWEEKWNKPFLSDTPKTFEESLSYVRCMTLNKKIDPLIYSCITPEILDEINQYIDLPMTATTFSKEKNSGRKTVITAEIIYYWMISLNIPFECQKWHLNKLLTLIKVCNIKNSPPKKMSKNAVAAKYRELNASRRKKHNTRG